MKLFGHTARPSSPPLRMEQFWTTESWVPLQKLTPSARLLRMRHLSMDFLDRYFAAEIPEILGSVGCYRIEGRGVQLFTEVTGDQFCIRGLPLIPILGALRDFGVLPV